jgi:hypothetical protein
MHGPRPYGAHRQLHFALYIFVLCGRPARPPCKRLSSRAYQSGDSHRLRAKAADSNYGWDEAEQGETSSLPLRGSLPKTPYQGALCRPTEHESRQLIGNPPRTEAYPYLHVLRSVRALTGRTSAVAGYRVGDGKEGGREAGDTHCGCPLWSMTTLQFVTVRPA